MESARKSEVRGRVTRFFRQTEKTRSTETYYSDFKEVDGLMLPMSMEMVLDGETVAKTKVTKVTFLEHIDEKEFAKPSAQK